MNTSRRLVLALTLAAAVLRAGGALALPPDTGGPGGPIDPGPVDPNECSSDDECDDGNVCNGAETCRGGAIRACVTGTPMVCDNGDACPDQCDPTDGCLLTACEVSTTTSLPPSTTSTSAPATATTTTTLPPACPARDDDRGSAIRLDPTFGAGTGLVAVAIGERTELADVEIGGDGRTWLVGTAPGGSIGQQLVLALGADGMPDPTFGESGVVRLGTNGLGAALLRDGDGMLVSGTEYRDATTTSPSAVNPSVHRLDRTGALVGPGGGLLGDVDGRALAGGLDRQADGRLLLGGQVKGGAGWVARLGADLQVDETFGGAEDAVDLPLGVTKSQLRGLVATAEGPVAVGTRMVGGLSYQVLVRFTEAGLPDARFGIGGIVGIDPPFGDVYHDWRLAAGADGTLVLTNALHVPAAADALVVLRRAADGGPDASFGGAGHVVIPMPCNLQQPIVVATLSLSAGRLLVVATASDIVARETVAVLAMIDARGALDPAFAHDGLALVPLGASPGLLGTGALGADGTVVLAGTNVVSGLEWHGVVARIDAGCGAATADVCDDGDPCTVDACGADGTCASVEQPGLAYVACVLDQRVHPRLQVVQGGARGRVRRLATRLLKHQEKAAALLARLMQPADAGNAKLLARAARLLGGVTQTTTRTRDRLGAVQADAIVEALNVATTRLQSVAGAPSQLGMSR